MKLELLLVLLGYILITGFALREYWTIKRANPVFWFLILQFLMAFGAFLQLDLESESDWFYVFLHFLFLLSFLTGAMLISSIIPLRKTYRNFYQSPVTKDAPTVNLWVFFIVGISAMITMIYYSLVGFNFTTALLKGGGFGVGSYSDMRLQAYSGEDYFAPGYVNQFKNVLLPAGLSILILRAWYQKKKKKLFIFLIFGVPFTIYALMGTGQRAFLVFSFIGFLFGLSLLFGGKGTSKKVSRRKLAIAMAGVFVLFSTFSYFYHKEKILDSKGNSLLVSVVKNVFTRVFIVQQEGGLIGYRYLYDIKRHDETEWLKDIASISPFFTYKSVAHEIHWVMYGTDRGTVPLSIVGAAYYNGGVFGTALYSLFMGIGYTFIYYLAIKGRRTIYRAMIFGPLMFYLALHISGSPVSLINNGVVTLLIMLFARRFLATIRQPGSKLRNRGGNMGALR